MATRTYWLDLFTLGTWQEFLDAGAQVSGFRDSRWLSVQRLVPGDYLLCYLTGISRFVGILEVTSLAYKDKTPIWKTEDFPCRVRVKIVIALKPETAIPIRDLWNALSVFKNVKDPHRWSGPFRGSPVRWQEADGEAVLKALTLAEANPTTRPIDQHKLKEPPKAYKTKIGSVTIPDSDEAANGQPDAPRDTHTHTEIQWLLACLGNDLGLHVWIARNDRGRDYNGHRFADLSGIKSELPRQFDEVTNRTIELIDVLWLRSNAIVAAFEIESTTSIYSGLLRMSDLIAMQPNLNIPLFLVAPDERQGKVM